MDEDKAEVRPNIDYIYSAVIADSEALEEAKMTLEVIKETDPGVYDEMINDTLALIRKALSSSILGVIEKTDAELRRLHEENLQWQEKCQTYIELHDAVVKDSDRLYALNAELVEALRDITVWYSARDSENEILPAINQNPEIYRAMQALAKAEGK